MAFSHQRVKRITPFWTIWFPLSIGILVVLALFGLIIFSSSMGNTPLSQWSQIATVILVILMMLVGFFLLFFMLFGVIGIQKLANRMPGWLEKISSISTINLARIRRVSTVTGNTTIFTESAIAQMNSAFKLMGSKFTRKKVR